MNNPMIVKAIVKSEFGADRSKTYGVGSIDTLTGLKFIGEKIHQYERDYSEGIDSLLKSDMFKFILEDDSMIAVRPFGIETKIKLYFGCNGLGKEVVDSKLNNIMKIQQIE